MERAHVLVRLRGDASASCTAGICCTSATTVRLEHSEMSPGVASITFEHVFDVNDSNSCVFQTSLTGAIDDVVDGKSATLIATGAANSGKSFACHGDQQKPSNGTAEPGLITLAIRRIFSCLETKLRDGGKFNVMLSCWGVRCNGSSENEALTDLLTSGTCVDVPVDDMEQVLLEHSVAVLTPAETVHLYSRALERVKEEEKQDFVVALHVETLSPHGEVRRGRLLVMDVNGGSIVEPQGEIMNQVEKERGQYFLDTQFSVNEVLSAGFGGFVGNTSATYLLAAIQTPAQYQQQAIQSLLYACKAKDIRSSSSVNYLSEFTERKKRLPRESEHQTAGCREDYIAPGAPHIETSSADQCVAFFSGRQYPPVSPPLSTTSSDSTYELPIAASPTKSPVHPSSRIQNILSGSEKSEKQSAISRRVRKAYDIAKAASSSPTKSRVTITVSSIQSGETVAHAAVDKLLKHVPLEILRGLTLEDKVEQLRTAQNELERALAHEISIKDKCVDRISRLSQTMSCQVVEHEQQLQEALMAKHAAEAQLQDLNIKFNGVGREVALLQDEIKKLKAGQKFIANNEDVQTPENERTMLHTLSARLEEAMIQAKDVITFKDSVIESLEERLQRASKRGADAVAMLDAERSLFEREKSDLLVQLRQSKNSWDSKKNEEVSKLQRENMMAQQQKAELTVKVAQLTLELETARSQWTQDVHDREDRAEEMCARQVAEAEQQLEQATAAMQQQMAQFRSELDMKVARQRVATQAACKAGELKCDQLERDLQRMKLKLSKQKIKMEKKARVLVASARKQHEVAVADLKRELEDLTERMEIVLEREQRISRQAKKSEEAVERLRTELKASVVELEQERATLENLCKETEQDKNSLKAEIDLRLREMEESLAKQIREAELRVHKERDGQVQKLMDQHDAEVRQLKAAVTEQEKTETTTAKSARIARPESSSTVSSRISTSGEDESWSSDSSHQHNINELDALIDSKKVRYRHLEKRRKPGSSATSPSSSPPIESSSSSLKRALAHKDEKIAELSARQKQLLAALATANEQETIAKNQIHATEAQRQKELSRYEDLLQQLNHVKQENWNLSLALNVTEASNQQQQRRKP